MAADISYDLLWGVRNGYCILFGPCPDQNFPVATKGVYRVPFATITISFARIFSVDSAHQEAPVVKAAGVL